MSRTMIDETSEICTIVNVSDVVVTIVRSTSSPTDLHVARLKEWPIQVQVRRMIESLMRLTAAATCTWTSTTTFSTTMPRKLGENWRCCPSATLCGRFFFNATEHDAAPVIGNTSIFYRKSCVKHDNIGASHPSQSQLQQHQKWHQKEVY